MSVEHRVIVSYIQQIYSSDIEPNLFEEWKWIFELEAIAIFCAVMGFYGNFIETNFQEEIFSQISFQFLLK